MSEEPVYRVWFITGASSGFGRAIAEAALERDEAVVAAARRLDALGELAEHDRVHAVRLDVTDAVQRHAAINEALDRFGRIDVLVNNAGRTQVGAVEETTDEELRALFDLHFFAPTALSRAVVPHMRRQGGGAIVQMSSVGGQVTAPDAAYESAQMPEYEPIVGPTRSYVRSNNGLQPGDPAKAAAAIIAALDADEPPLRLVLGADAIGNIERRLRVLTGELETWRSVGEATAIEAA
jgi:hypothetical protein